jgi:Bacterial Ig-like domain (group 2)
MRQIAAIGGLVLLSGCGGGGGSPTPPSRVPQSLTVNPAATNLIKIAQEQTYTASTHYSTGADSTVSATWQSDNQNVASIDGTGKATGLDSGEATLIAKAEGLTGTLKIRVVPDYQGTWNGEYVIRACRASGGFDPKDFCSADGFKAGQRLPITFALTQDRDRLSGSVFIGTLEHTLDASSAIRVDGGAALSGAGSATVEDVKVDTTINPVAIRASGPSLTGSFTLTLGVSGVAGSAAFDAHLGAVTRTAATASLRATSFHFSSLRDLIEAARRE